MNICFLIGKIVSEIKYDFVLNKFNYSVVNFEVVLDNLSIVKIKGYNEIADYCYKNICENNYISIQGEIHSDGSIEIKHIDE